MPGGNAIGIRTVSFVPAGVTTNTNTVLANVPGLTFNTLAGETWWLRFTIPFSTGATGGAKFEVTCPAAPTLYECIWALYEAGTPGTLADTAVISTSPASFTNALAAAATHYMTATAFIKASASGTIGLMYAQNNSQAAALTLLQGGIMEVYQMS